MKRESRTKARTVDYEAIAQRAYERYLARGCEDGCDVEDWLTAETQLLQECTDSSQAPAVSRPKRPQTTKPNQFAGRRAA